LIGLDIEAEEFLDALQDGVVLCSIANAICPGSVPKVHPAPKLAFKQLENITNFINACKRFGLVPTVLFDPQELSAKRNVSPVLTCLLALSDMAATKFNKGTSKTPQRLLFQVPKWRDSRPLSRESITQLQKMIDEEDRKKKRRNGST